MADPVSAIAGLVGVSRTILLVVESLQGISESVDTAHDDIKLLAFDLEDIRRLTEYLQQKSRAIESINKVIAQACCETVQRCVEQLNSAVARIQKHLKDCGLNLHGRHQTFTSAWRKYKWHQKRPLIREIRQELQDLKIKLSTVMQMLSMETRHGSSSGGTQATGEDQRTNPQSPQAEEHFKHSQRQCSSEQQPPPGRQDNTQPTNLPADGRCPNRTREEITAVFDGFPSATNASSPHPGHYLESLLEEFPWPPPDWDTLELSPQDVHILRQLDFVDLFTISRLSRHIYESARYHEANHRLLKCRKRTECGRSGLGNWIRKQYWWHVSERSLKHGHPSIRMSEYEYTPVEEAIWDGIWWQDALRTHVMNLNEPSVIQGRILGQLSIYLSEHGQVA